MRKRTQSIEVLLRREELHPGLILEHFQKRVNEKDVYLLKIEVQIFKIVDLTIDLSQSAHIQMPDSPDLVKKVKVEPFTKSTVAKIVLLKKWAIKPKLSFKLSTPPLDLQKKLTENYNKELRQKTEQMAALTPLDFKAFPLAKSLEFLQQRKTVFIDSEFPPAAESLCPDSLSFEGRLKVVAQWRRAKYLYYPAAKANQSGACPPWLFSHEFRESTLNDMKKASSARQFASFDPNKSPSNPPSILEQEFLETQKHNIKFLSNEGLDPGLGSHDWLTAALAAVKTHPDILRQIFASSKPNPQGFYLLRLHFMGRKSLVQLDDYLPCSAFGDPLFLGRGQQPMPDFGFFLLEKAFAKRRGSYYRLKEGNIASCLTDLTGAPVIELSLEESGNEQKDRLWSDLEEWTSKKYIIMAEKNEELQQTISISDKQKIAEQNIAKPKASYFVLNSVETDENGIRIVKMSTQPKTQARLATDEVEQKPESIAPKQGGLHPESLIGIDLSPSDLPIPFSSLIANFQKLIIAKTRFKEKLRVKGKFVSRPQKDQPLFLTQNFLSRWAYKIELKSPSKLVIGLHQEDENCIGVRETRPNIDIGLAVFRQTKTSQEILHFWPSKIAREAFYEFELETGFYTLVPFSLGIYNKDESLMRGITSHDKRNPIVVSVVNDIYEKLNMSGNDLLTFTELKNLYKILGLGSLSELDFLRLVAKYTGSGTLQTTEPEGMTPRAFVDYFFDLLETNKDQKQAERNFFQALGYDETLYSFSSRVFMLTIYSDKFIEIEWKDNIREDAEAEVIGKLLAKYGRRVAIFSEEDKVFPLVLSNE